MIRVPFEWVVRQLIRFSKSIALGVLGLLMAMFSPVQAEERNFALRWGVAFGVEGVFPVGSDVRQSEALEEEFAPGVQLRFEVVTIDLTRYLELVPFARFTIRGGVNEARYEELLATENASSFRGDLFQIGAGIRVFPVQLNWFRPFISGYGAYSQAQVEFEFVSTEVPSESPFGAPLTLQRHRHSGGAMILGAGVRADIPIRIFQAMHLLPVIAEVQWTQNFWRDLQSSEIFEPFADALAPRRMNLNNVNVVLAVGYKI